MASSDDADLPSQPSQGFQEEGSHVVLLRDIAETGIDRQVEDEQNAETKDNHDFGISLDGGSALSCCEGHEDDEREVIDSSTLNSKAVMGFLHGTRTAIIVDQQANSRSRPNDNNNDEDVNYATGVIGADPVNGSSKMTDKPSARYESQQDIDETVISPLVSSDAEDVEAATRSPSNVSSETGHAVLSENDDHDEEMASEHQTDGLVNQRGIQDDSKARAAVSLNEHFEMKNDNKDDDLVTGANDIEDGNDNENRATTNLTLDRTDNDIETGIDGRVHVALTRSSSSSRNMAKGDKLAKGGSVVRIAPNGWREARATEPGAEYVPQRAPGSMVWFVERMRSDTVRRYYQQQQQRTEQQAQQQQAQEEHSRTTYPRPLPATADSHWYNSKLGAGQRTRYLVGIIVVCLALAGTAIGLGVSFGRSNHQQRDTTTKFNNYTHNCGALSGEAHPHVLSQCYCYGNISSVPSDVATRYYQLSKTFITTVLPNFQQSIDSCHPQNQALVWLASGDGTPTNPNTISQRYTLALFFILMNGTDWNVPTTWLSSADECVWLGVTCDDQGHVNALLLSANNVTGTIPSELALLTSLATLDLSTNQLQGGIPDELFNITGLKDINLVGSQLGGPLPVHLSELSSLQSLRLSSNEFNGTLPSEYGRLSSLLTFDLGQNLLTGRLPTEIGLWTTVTFLNLGHNNLVGSTIPTEMGLLTRLETLMLDSSYMKGRIPKELFNIGASLLSFEANSNAFTGTIPTQVGQAINMKTFMVESNQLRGTIPTQFGLVTTIQYLDISYNQMTGTVPTELGQVLAGFEYFCLEGNKFTGTVPHAVCMVANPVSCITSLSCNCCSCVLILHGGSN